MTDPIAGEESTRCRWDDKPIIFWNERWSHTELQDQKECHNPVPFEDDNVQQK